MIFMWMNRMEIRFAGEDMMKISGWRLTCPSSMLVHGLDNGPCVVCLKR
jgi:hypothetical protein